MFNLAKIYKSPLRLYSFVNAMQDVLQQYCAGCVQCKARHDRHDHSLFSRTEKDHLF